MAILSTGYEYADLVEAREVFQMAQNLEVLLAIRTRVEETLAYLDRDRIDDQMRLAQGLAAFKAKLTLDPSNIHNLELRWASSECISYSKKRQKLLEAQHSVVRDSLGKLDVDIADIRLEHPEIQDVMTARAEVTRLEEIYYTVQPHPRVRMFERKRKAVR